MLGLHKRGTLILCRPDYEAHVFKVKFHFFQELVVYRKAFFCAQYPVLSAPDPPPVSSPTLMLVTRPRSTYSSLSESLSLTSDPGAVTAEMEYSMISSELLCDWLRQVFGLSKITAESYESLFREGSRRKSYSKVCNILKNLQLFFSKTKQNQAK